MKTRMEEKKTATTLYLPPELIIQILLRLPVKSLICFKSVCKSWFTIISDSNFANSHFHLSESTQTRRVLSISSTEPQEIQTIDFEALVNNHAASLSLNIPHSRSDFPLQIKGSCRGFLFLADCFKLYLWNPSSRFHKQIPLSDPDSFISYLYGFGYDRSRDDYVVVVSICYGYNRSHLEFFSLRDNMWKEIEGIHFPYKRHSLGGYIDNGGTILNEAIHWLAYRHDLLMDVIVVFDLMERKLLEMRPPKENDFITINCGIGLWVFGEFLSLWEIRVDRVEIWVMKEYKVHSSWTKNIVLPIDTLPTKYFRPIYSTKNGDVIGTDGGSGLMKYNDKGQLLEYHSCYNNLFRSEMIMYTESLLSLPGDCKQV